LADAVLLDPADLYGGDGCTRICRLGDLAPLVAGINRGTQ